MEQNIYVDIFYIVASLSIITITIGIVFIFKDAIPTVRNIHTITEKVRHESDLIVKDVDGVRTSLRHMMNALLKYINFTKK